MSRNVSELKKLSAALNPALLVDTHERVREAAKTRGRVTIQPVLPVDILGVYVLLPRNPGVPA